MIDVSMRQDHEIEFARIEREVLEVQRLFVVAP